MGRTSAHERVPPDRVGLCREFQLDGVPFTTVHYARYQKGSVHLARSRCKSAKEFAALGSGARLKSTILSLMLAQTRRIRSPEEMERFAQELAPSLGEGDVVLLSGPLGVGKTTWVRGLLRGLGWQDAVRSPSFNLLQTFETSPRVLHADLYRLAHAQDIGLEDYLDSHLCLVEWPENLAGFLDPASCWQVELSYEGELRLAVVRPPGG